MPDNLVLTTYYYGSKATELFSNSSGAGATQLKRDLEKLRFPSPKIQNIRFVSYGCMMAVWIDPNHHIRQCLRSAVQMKSTNSASLYKQADLERLSISSFVLESIPFDDMGRLYPGFSSDDHPLTRPQHPRAPATFPLPPRPPSQAPVAPSRPRRRQSIASSSNLVPLRRPASTVKRPAENHDSDHVPNKRVKMDLVTMFPDPGVPTASSSNPPLRVPRNSELAKRETLKVANTHNTISASPAGNNSQQHGAGVPDPKQITSSPASISLSRHMNATASSLPQPVTPRSHPTPQPISMSRSPVPKPATNSSPLNPHQKPMDLDHTPSKQPRLDTPNFLQSFGPFLPTGEGSERKIVLPVEMIEANGRLMVTKTVYGGFNVEPQLTNGAVTANQSSQRLSTSHLDSPVPPTKEEQIKELERQLNIARRELKDLRQTLRERTTDLGDAQKTAAASEKALENEQEKLKKTEEELQERKRVQVEIEEQLSNEQDKRVRLEQDLSNETTEHIKAEEEWRREWKLRVETANTLATIDATCQEMKAERDKSLTLVESMRKEAESLGSETARANQAALQTKMKTDELEQRLDEEIKRRAELEEELERERGRRVGAEAMLKDVERECRAPFVVPSLLAAFTTISSLTTQVLETAAPYSPESITQLKQDLEKLEFPVPSESNVSFVSAGCMRASWICSLDSSLYNRIKTLVYRTKSPSFTQFWSSSTPANLEISWITLTEKPVEDLNIRPDSDIDTPVHSSSGSGNKMKLKRAHTIDVMPTNAAVTGSTPLFADLSRPANTSHMPPPVKDDDPPGPVVYNWVPESSKGPNQNITSHMKQRTAHTFGIPLVQSSRRTSIDSGTSFRLSSRGRNASVLREGGRHSERFDELLADETKTCDFERQLANERAARARLKATYNRARRALDTIQGKLANVDDELKRERERSTNLEIELASEQRKRQDVENILKDVERECRTPFLVPAILDAFCMISKITNWTMDVDHPIDGGPDPQVSSETPT